MEMLVVLVIGMIIFAICSKYGYKPLFIGLGLILAVLLAKAIAFIFGIAMLCGLYSITGV